MREFVAIEGDFLSMGGGVVVLIKCFVGYTVWSTTSVNQDLNLTMLSSYPQRVAMHLVDQDGNRGDR